MEGHCRNPRHKGSYHDFRTNTRYTAPIFNIKDDYLQWCFKNNQSPVRQYEEFLHIYSVESEAYLVSNNDWLCKDCLTFKCFYCKQFIGNSTHISDYVNKMNSSSLGHYNKFDFNPGFRKCNPTKKNGYICGGETVFAWPQGYLEGRGGDPRSLRQLTYEEGTKLQPHKGLHQVYVMVDTFDPNNKMKLLVNICGDCYNEDPREIIVMRQELEELRAKQIPVASSSTSSQCHTYMSVSDGVVTYSRPEQQLPTSQYDVNPLGLDALTTSKLEVLSEMSVDIKPKVKMLVDDQYTEVCKTIRINIESLKAAYHNLEILKIGGMSPDLINSMALLKKEIDKFQKYLELQVRMV